MASVTAILGQSRQNPSSFQFSCDDKELGCLHTSDASNFKLLHVLNMAKLSVKKIDPPDAALDTEESLSLEEKLRRERQRLMAVGMTNYAWSQNEKGPQSLLALLQGNIYVAADSEAEFKLLFDKSSTGLSGGAVDPHFSPDGNYIAFVQDAELHTVHIPSRKVKQLTFGARASGKTNALADFIAQEEMDRYRGFWWSPDGTKIAFIEVDESHIPEYHIHHTAAATPDVTESHRYPFAGAANAKLRLGVVTLDGPKGNVKWVEIGPKQDMYLARVDWLVDGSLTAQVQNRQQTLLTVLRFSASTVGLQASGVDAPALAKGQVLLEDRAKYWTNLHDNLKSFVLGGVMHVLWTTESSRSCQANSSKPGVVDTNGFMHLQLYRVDKAGAIFVRQITWGKWMVEKVVGVDTEKGWVYFTSTAADVLQSHLFAVALPGKKAAVPALKTVCPIIKLTADVGMHQTIVMNHSASCFVDAFSSLEYPGATKIFDIIHSAGAVSAKQRVVLHKLTTTASVDFEPPEIVSFPAADKKTKLYGAVFKPLADDIGKGPYPTIVYMYGGPHVQLVKNHWRLSSNGRIQQLRNQGFLVFVCDNRGGSRRGVDFEGAIHLNMGSVEVLDQVAGVDYLVANKLADPARVGCYGWSYGGYMTALCLAKAPKTFTAGVSGAPVTHWDGYDTHYTERYMSTPKKNPGGYATSSVMAHVEGMTGKLMLVHGLIDENVHFRHTARLINALVSAQKDYELLLFPSERHSPRNAASRTYMDKRLMKFFSQHLLGGKL